MKTQGPNTRGEHSGGELQSAGLPWRLAVVISLLVILGGLLRLAGTFNDLWLDEIWSRRFAAQASSPLGILFKLRHDNNHWANTIWLYYTQQSASPTLMRLPAVVLGTAAIVLMAVLGLQRGAADGLLAALLGAVAYPLIHYSSEARGYAGAMCFALLGAWSAGRFMTRPQLRWALLFWASVLIAALWHLTSLMAYGGILLWTAWRLWRPDKQGIRHVAAWFALHGVAAASLLAFYFLAVRGMSVGGGEQGGLAESFASALAWTAGYGAGGVSLLAAFGAIAVAAAGCLVLWRGGSDLYILYTGVVVCGWLLALTSEHADFLHPRYFLVCLPFVLLAQAHALAEGFRRPGGTRLACAVLLVVFLVGNALQMRRFLADGRGRYREAIADIARSTDGPEIRIASDHDFRHALLLEYYEPLLGEKRFAYFDAANAPGAEWMLIHRFELDLPPPPDSQLFQFQPGGPAYRFVAIYRHGGLSGWTWLVFRRVD